MPGPDYYRDLFENAPCGYLVLDVDGAVVRANAGFLRLIGVADQHQLCRSFRDLLTSAGAIYYDTQVLPSLLLNGQRGEVALDLRVDGRRIPVLANFSLEYKATEVISSSAQGGQAGLIAPSPTGEDSREVLPAREPSHIRVVLFNATERRLYEKDLLRSRKEAEQLSEVILHSSDAIITAGVDGRVRHWNMGAAEMFGYSFSEAAGVWLWTLIPSFGEEERFRDALEALGAGREFSWEALSHNRRGVELEISIKLTPHMEAPGTLVAFSAIVRDISKQKVAERALLQSEKLASVGRLASSIAHEINNPLAAVTNLLFLIDLQANTPELKQFAQAAQDELSRVSQITSHTLRFHRQSSRPTDLNLKSLFESVVALNRARLRNAEIATEISASCGDLHCHEGELRQIVLNIAANAIDAMKLGGTLSFRCREARSASTGVVGIRIVIADNGTGMDAATAARIFEPFFTTKGIGGTGLGLWVTRDLVQKNRGTIRVRSSKSSQRHGTAFSLFFPHQAA